MERGAWRPTCKRPLDLQRPLRAGRRGTGTLTWDQANCGGYERVGKGLYVPVDRRRSVEQRIVDAAARLRADGSRGAVTGWASLRWRGASYFDGLDPSGTDEVPVELVVPTGRHLGPWPEVLVRRRLLGPVEVEVVDGLPVTTVARALFDEIATRDDLWRAVQAIDMTAAARLISVWLFGLFAGECNARVGAPLVREAVSLAADESLSPREPWFRLVWVQLAGLPDPLVNQPVYDLRGRLIGVPDLFDPDAGLVGEYSGEIHRGAVRHRKDVVREEDFREHGLEYVEVVRGDSADDARRRILSARERARHLPPGQRRWTVQRPVWDPAPETLDAHLERTGQARRLAACDSTHPDSPLLPPQPWEPDTPVALPGA